MSNTTASQAPFL